MSDSIVRAPGGAQPDNPPRGTPASDDVTLVLNGKIWSGWTAVRIGRGVERFPSDFELALTERYPGEAGALMVEPGTTCVLKIGSDIIITGVVDRYVPAITATGHEVRIHGRSRCRAIVDCSAGVLPDGSWKTQFASSTAIGVITQLCDPFGITVSTTAADAANAMVPPFILNLGETPAEVIDRASRWAGLLYFDDTAGNLVLAQVGDRKMSSGFQQGVNIEAASATYSADQRFSLYVVVWMSLDGLINVRNDVDGSTNGNSRYVLADGSAPAIGFRPHVIVSEQVDQSTDFAKVRATWEMNRRNGRSRAVTLTTDSWRDSAGKLWEPNALTKVNAPHLKITNQTWVIGEVTYRRDASGTHADLTLMPPGAYAPEPFVLQPINRQVAGELKGGAQTESPTGAANPTGKGL